jgi:hypothetical protein
MFEAQLGSDILGSSARENLELDDLKSQRRNMPNPKYQIEREAVSRLLHLRKVRGSGIELNKTSVYVIHRG